ncbi:hypothetical protein Athai_14800 [Actinocatenispora thailandica]|uniref:Uncharacterized protein n=1 Tax=Actinocatenispora thailandica TaxID=227318 RepID=A0A7R7DMA6_9ACTN|nr:hypothetical protein [Actinocatenispora thailandica]BCJ33977.1 hypothetical protein Athai_14800 [Actinocatenispora thailandica]
MAFHRIDEVPDVRLAHFLDFTSTTYYNTQLTSTRWAVQPIAARRPAEGSARHRVHCGTCRQSVEVLVPSAERTLRIQRIWLAVLVAGLAVLVAVVGYLAARSDWTSAGGALAAVLILTLVILLSVAPLLAALDRAQHAHGVRIAPGQPRAAVRRHSIRLPKARGARYRPRAAGSAARPTTAPAATVGTRDVRAAPATGAGAKAGTVKAGPVFALRPGTGRDTVLARLGPPAGDSTGAEAVGVSPRQWTGRSCATTVRLPATRPASCLPPVWWNGSRSPLVVRPSVTRRRPTAS